MIRISSHNTVMPTPFKNIPRIISIKYRSGIIYVISWMLSGIEYIGKINPENKIAGRKNKNDESIACCCVFEIVDMNNPIASVDMI